MRPSREGVPIIHSPLTLQTIRAAFLRRTPPRFPPLQIGQHPVQCCITLTSCSHSTPPLQIRHGHARQSTRDTTSLRHAPTPPPPESRRFTRARADLHDRPLHPRTGIHAHNTPPIDRSSHYAPPTSSSPPLLTRVRPCGRRQLHPPFCRPSPSRFRCRQGSES